MKVEIESSPSKPKMGLLLIEGEEWKEVYKPFFRKKLKNIPAHFSLPEVKEFLEKIEFDGGLSYALNVLSVRSQSEKELREKLSKRALMGKSTDIIVAKCIHYGYIDDDRDILLYIESQIKKGKGPIVISMKTRQKFGSCPELFDIYPIERQIEIASTLRKRDSKEKTIRFLLSRGFPYDIVTKIV